MTGRFLLVADALKMGVHLIFDTRRPELLKLATSGRLTDIPDDVTYGTVSFEGPRGLAKGLEWARWFDAAAKVEAVRSRKLAALARGHHGQVFTLEGTELADFNAVLRRSAERALVEIAATRDHARSFLIYLCERWDEWSRRGWSEVAGEYTRVLPTHCTRGCGCIGHPAFPAPSVLGGTKLMHTSGASRRGIERVVGLFEN
jgi:hypothetical protein